MIFGDIQLDAGEKAELSVTKPLKTVGRNGKKTAGNTAMSKCEQMFVDCYCKTHGLFVIAKEPFALYCLDARVYTPDFCVLTTDNELALVEVKSYNPLPNEQRAIDAFTDSSRRNPQIQFWWARDNGRGDGSFTVSVFKGGKEVAA